MWNLILAKNKNMGLSRVNKIHIIREEQVNKS